MTNNSKYKYWFIFLFIWLLLFLFFVVVCHLVSCFNHKLCNYQPSIKKNISRLAKCKIPILCLLFPLTSWFLFIFEPLLKTTATTNWTICHSFNVFVLFFPLYFIKPTILGKFILYCPFEAYSFDPTHGNTHKRPTWTLVLQGSGGGGHFSCRSMLWCDTQQSCRFRDWWGLIMILRRW